MDEQEFKMEASPGVYISYPFCNQKCSFCNFSSGVSPVETRVRYDPTLLNELQSHSWDRLPDTVYFGGGTPSLMPLETMAALMNRIPRANLREVTLECAPGTVNREAAEEWKRCGIDRVSLGVQSFVEVELRQTGRRHSAETVRFDVETLRQAGIHNVNIDLIAGLPQQTLESWEYSLGWIEHLKSPHVSVYIFEIDENSRLGKEILLGGVRYGADHLPSEQLTAELYERAAKRLAALGLNRYEISNFAAAGHESRHNLKYWRLEPYVGFGLDAHSFNGKERWSNPDTLPAYFEQQSHVHIERHEVAATDASEEHFFVGLRLMEGITPTAQEWFRFAEPISRWVQAGMLERDGPWLRLAEPGILLSNEIFQDFIHA
ncbi:MAG: radical SAM family heme chaperone HemW [Bryobacteraceae bacterium]